MITSAARMITSPEPAAPIAGDQAERAADRQRERDRGRGDRERVLGGDDDPREDAAPERIGAQDVEPAVVQREGRGVAPAQVHLGRDVLEQRRAEQRAQHHEAEIERRDERELVAPEQQERLPPGPLERRQRGLEGRARAHHSCRMRGSSTA